MPRCLAREAETASQPSGGDWGAFDSGAPGMRLVPPDVVGYSYIIGQVPIW